MHTVWTPLTKKRRWFIDTWQMDCWCWIFWCFFPCCHPSSYFQLQIKMCSVAPRRALCIHAIAKKLLFIQWNKSLQPCQQLCEAELRCFRLDQSCRSTDWQTDIVLPRATLLAKNPERVIGASTVSRTYSWFVEQFYVVAVTLKPLKHYTYSTIAYKQLLMGATASTESRDVMTISHKTELSSKTYITNQAGGTLTWFAIFYVAHFSSMIIFKTPVSLIWPISLDHATQGYGQGDREQWRKINV